MSARGRRLYILPDGRVAVLTRARVAEEARSTPDVPVRFPAGGRREPGATERAAAALARAAFYRWKAAGMGLAAGVVLVRGCRVLAAGNDGHSGVPWDRSAGQRHHDGNTAPTAAQAIGHGRAVAKAAARYWLGEAAAWSARAHSLGRGVPA